MRRALLSLVALGLTACPGNTSTPNDTGGTDATDITTQQDGASEASADGTASDASASDASDVMWRTFDVNIPTDVGSCSPTTPSDDTLAAMRQSCTFQPGAHVADTIGDLTDARSHLTHIIVVMQENHTLDNMFGMTGHGIEGIPAGVTIPTPDGGTVGVNHETRACTPNPNGHQWDEMHTAWNNGAMDGFAMIPGADIPTTMGYYTDDDHPFYTWAATTFATADHYFADVLGGTWSNRDYLLLGSRYGVYVTGICSRVRNSPTVLDQLVAAGVQWGAYVGEGSGSGQAFEGALCFNQRTGGTPPQVSTLDDFMARLHDGTLPPVSFVETGENVYDEHPPANVHLGEDKVREITASVMASPLWAQTALFLTYDEGGGYYDHMPPPPACAPDSYEPPNDPDHADTQDTVYGMRVPFVLVSPWSRPGYVSHRVHSHASILRFIEALYDLPALTVRDANSDALLDLFDFSCPSFFNAPTNIPAARIDTTGCQ